MGCWECPKSPYDLFRMAILSEVLSSALRRSTLRPEILVCVISVISFYATFTSR